MKTIYEEKYNKAIESAKRELKSCGTLDCDAAKQIFRIFPELQKSEDELIREELIKFLERQNFISYESDNDYRKWISWLENQKTIGESLNISTTEECEKYHKAIDSCLDNKDVINMCQPKFKVGDYVTNDDSSVVAQIEDVSTNCYYTFKKIKPSISYSAPNCEFVDKYYHLWTIEDAKDGDVLSQDNIPFIFKSWDNNCIAYCGITDSGLFEIVEDNFSWCNSINVVPATKEQREFLFQKMHEAGYEWDAENKQVRKNSSINF